ncbi:MAG: hypothetical protein MZV65_40675, partial [Chromatiales bacterium]|nr:hypothetical protein [Chromatiales bacterium]
MENYGSIDALHKAWGEAATRIGTERFRALHGRMAALETGRVLKFWTFRPDISFLPVPERLKPEEYGYYTLGFRPAPPRHAKANSRPINREWAALSRGQGRAILHDLSERLPAPTSRSMSGSNTGNRPRITPWPKRPFWKALGVEGPPCPSRTRALIRKQETKTGRYRP